LKFLQQKLEEDNIEEASYTMKEHYFVMYLEKIVRLHSNTELALAIIDNWCEKHQQKPQFCGATKEARELLGDVLKGVGALLFIAALFRGLK